MPRSPSTFTKDSAGVAGKKSAAKLSPQELSLRASQLGNITLQRYGVDYYTSIIQHRWAQNKRIKDKLR
jgi:hypothetical protein